MSKRDFFRVIIRVLGLYVIIASVLSSLPGNLAFVLTSSGFDAWGVIWGIGTLITIWGLIIFLVFKPDKVIDSLRLDQGFDNSEFNLGEFDSFKLIKLTSLIVGGLIFIKEIPAFLSYTFFAFKSNFQDDFDPNGLSFGTTEDYIYWAASFLGILSGYLLIKNSEWVARRLTKND